VISITDHFVIFEADARLGVSYSTQWPSRLCCETDIIKLWLHTRSATLSDAEEESIAICYIQYIPLKCNVALVRDSHSRLDHSQSTIEGVTYEKRPRNKFVLGSLNSRMSWFSSDSQLQCMIFACASRLRVASLPVHLRVPSPFSMWKIKKLFTSSGVFLFGL